MKNNYTKEQREAFIAKCLFLIEEQSDMESLYEKMDNILFQHSIYLLQDKSLGNDKMSEVNDLCLLKSLRDLFLHKTE